MDYPAKLVPERTLTHSHLSWSLIILYLLPPSTTNHSILPVQFICLTVCLHSPSESPLWSTACSGTLYFTLHTFQWSSEYNVGCRMVMSRRVVVWPSIVWKTRICRCVCWTNSCQSLTTLKCLASLESHSVHCSLADSRSKSCHSSSERSVLCVLRDFTSHLYMYIHDYCMPLL